MKKQLDAIMAMLAFSSPFSGTFFQCDIDETLGNLKAVFVPFLGDFLSITSNVARLQI